MSEHDISVHTYATRLLLATTLLCGVTPAVFAKKPPPDLEMGKAVYQQQCARCHGLTGAGDGIDAKRLFPKPRDLTSGMYKFRTTASGTAPTDADVFQTITKGLPGGGMPDWAHLEEAARWQVVQYLKTLSPVFTDNPPEPIPMGRDPGPARADLAQGKQVYQKLGCAACHGAEGLGNGASAPSLVDGWGLPTRPANLVEGWNYRGGATPPAIVARVLAGIDGSVMPSYAEAATPEEVWQLAYYVHSLQRQPRWAVLIRAPFRPDGLPTSLDDPQWQDIAAFDVRLRNVVDAAGEMTAPTSVTTARLQVVYNEEALSVRLQWDDATKDAGDLVDAAALILRPPAVKGDVVSLQTWPMLKGSPALDVCLWSARRDETREAVVRELESLMNGTASSVSVMSQASYADGRWTLMVTRPLAQAGIPEAAQLAMHQFVPVGLAVWDGGNGQARAVSTWIDIALEPQAAAHATEASGSLVMVWIISGIVLVVALALVFRS